MKTRLMSAAFALGLLCLGCEPELTEATFTPQDIVDSADEDVRTIGTNMGTLNRDMTGTWVQITDYSTCISPFNVLEESRNVTVMKVDVVQNDRWLSETHTACSIVSSPVLGASVTIPREALLTISPIFVRSTLIERDGTMEYTGGTQYQIWGIRLDDPLTEPLPTSDEYATDPRIFDAENDGNPGATFIAVGGCEIHTIMRTLSSMRGTMQDDGSIVGTGDTISQQINFPTGGSLCSAAWNSFPNTKDNTARMIRIDDQGLDLDANGDGDVSCDEIMAVFDQIYTPIEKDNARCER